MNTNQAAVPNHELPHKRCDHEPGQATRENCRYLRTLHRLRVWTERAEQAHIRGEAKPESIGELWLILAELSYAHDHCPNHTLPHETVAPDCALALTHTAATISSAGIANGLLGSTASPQGDSEAAVTVTDSVPA